MENVIYFLTVVPVGLAILGFAWKYDEKHVPVGQNFMPSLEEMKDFI